MTHDLTLVLRVYPGIIARQKVFCEDKFTLYKKSLMSCIQWLWNLKCFVYVLLDNCPMEYHTYTKNALKHIDHEIIAYDKKQWNAQTFAKQVELLSEQKYSDICLFLEDDYIHLPWSLEKFVDMMKHNPQINFWTTYLSPDYQNMIIHNYRPKLLYYKNDIYGTFASTTMTFYCTKISLKKYKKELLSYSKWNHDFSMWFSMTKLGVYNIGNMITALFTNFFQFKLFWYMRYKCLKYIIKAPKTNLYAPLVSWSTHIDSKWIPPGTDRNKVWESISI